MKRRDQALKIVAGLSALVVLFVGMLGPMLIFRLSAGIALNAKGPDWEIWILILGGGVGSGLGRLTHDLILRNVGKFSEREIEESWRGR